MFAQDERVYVKHARHNDRYLALVEHTYTTNGTLCVHLYDGTNVLASDVMTYDAYWRRQRDMLAQSVEATEDRP